MIQFIILRVITGNTATNLEVVGKTTNRTNAEEVMKKDVERLFDELLDVESYKKQIDLSMLKGYEDKKSYLESHTETIISGKSNFSCASTVVTTPIADEVSWFIKDV